VTLDGHDKASGAAFLLRTRFDIDPTASRVQAAFIGDSENDAACFAAFRTTIGVANLSGRPTVTPRFVTASPRGQGFAEAAEVLVQRRDPNAAPPVRNTAARVVREGTMEPTEAELLKSAGAHLYANYRQPPLVLVRGRGTEVWDSTGKRYLDLAAGIAVVSLGHAHPAWVEAVATQAGRLAHVSNYFFNVENVKLAERLTRATGMDRVFFCNSGTEAIEATLKLARRFFFAKGEKDRVRIIAFDNSFHGRTLGALAATGQKGYREGFGPLSPVTHVPYGDLAAVRAELKGDVAGVLVEPVQGEGGVLPAPAGFLKGLRALCDESGALLLADEVQTGIGRTGRFLAFEHAGVSADVVALAKGLGGGFPIGAMLCKERFGEALPPGSHGSTFGGNALASAAALAVLTTVETEHLTEGARDKGDHLARLLASLASRHERLVEGSRGLGLLQALVLKESVDARAVVGALRDAGLLVTVAGSRALRFSPPLTVSIPELDEGASIVDRVLSAL
jgi:acetylornithine/N-succinyldiaminopimelate aminotransferase